MRMKDMGAIVTGGASGFGEGICRAYAGEGARVLIGDLDEANGLVDAAIARWGRLQTWAVKQ